MPDIYIHNGTDIASMAAELMQKADIASRLGPSAKVCIKPNLVVARPADGGATTHPELVEGIILYLMKAGVRDIYIAEGSWVGDSTTRAFKCCGYEPLIEKYGIRIVDTKRDSVVKKSAGGHDFLICESIATCDYLINVPVLKGHCQTKMTCCLKNMKGCIPDSEKRRFHSDGLHKPIALLNTIIRPDLHIIDGICGDLTFEEGGNPVRSNRILLGFDPVLLDSFCAGLMGYQPDEIEHLMLARRYGAGNYYDAGAEICELGAGSRPKVLPAKSGVVRRLADKVEEDGACSACYAALIFALNKAGYRGVEKIKIGQGFRGVKGPGLGIGDCASGCDNYVEGCPPPALDIVRVLEGKP